MPATSARWALAFLVPLDIAAIASACKWPHDGLLVLVFVLTSLVFAFLLWSLEQEE